MSGICSVSCALSGGYGEDLLINYVCSSTAVILSCNQNHLSVELLQSFPLKL